MRFYRHIFTLILLVGTIMLSAQNVEFVKKNFLNDKKGLKEAQSHIKEGDKLFYADVKSYAKAIGYYRKAYQFNKKNAKLNYKLGVCYYKTKSYKNAIDLLESARSLDPNVDIKCNYYLAITYQRSYQFDSAIVVFNEFRKQLNPKVLKKYEESIQRHIEECKSGKILYANPVRVFIDELPTTVNTKDIEYGPVINADESVLFFTSSRPENVGGKKDPFTNDYYEDVYVSYRGKNGKWSKARNLGKPINTNGPDAVVGLSADGQRLYIYRSEGGGDIYYSKLDGEEWTKPKKMHRNINSDAHEASAAFSSDYMSIFFVSDRKDGYGKHDIYMCKRGRNGKWLDAQNIGAKINTPFEEAAVFAHPDGKTFYFSSKGHNTMGGYDIFSTVYNNGAWSEPVNLGYPINTTEDDVFLSISASGRHAYYASTADSKNKSNIFMITFLGPEKPLADDDEDQLIAYRNQAVRNIVAEAAVEVHETQLTIVKGTIIDEFTKQPIYALIEITDNSTNEIIATFESNKSSGKYLISLPSGKDYGIAVKAEECLFYSSHINIDTAAGYQEIVKDVYLKRIAVGSKVVLSNLFFASGKSKLKKESTTELENLLKLMNDAPNLKIEISGYTDNTGSDKVNQKLSKARAKAVVDYLVSKGISADRLTYKGYGSKQAVADNATEEGRQKNRRTEFKVIAR
jgi:outer membrane protein OmpA-like peptidoglycan-associated protein/tetratricopeptide (TPR) repeat protein